MATEPGWGQTVAAGAWGKRPLRELLEDSPAFVTIAELVTSRGLISDPGSRRVLGLARALAEHPRFDALSITDNPGGHAMLSADTIGTDLVHRGQEVIIHLSCKDWNRNALESRCWKLASEGFRNVLALSGDYPVSGYHGQSAPVFDLDSVGLLQLLSEIHGGHFFPGAVVTNYKRLESEVMPQYFKLARKIRSGARFVINQIGYNARKMDELLRYMALHGMNVPVVANIFVLSVKSAQYFHAAKVPGVIVTDGLLALVEKHAASPDKGKSFLLEFAAKQCAVARGLGFRGMYLGGHLCFDDYERILAILDSFAPDDWREFAREIQFPLPGEFYYFERDESTGLCSGDINREYLRAKGHPSAAPLAYRFSRAVHDRVFAPGTAGFHAGKSFYRAVERAPWVARALHGAEQSLKVLAFDCRDCGDCSLPEIAYLCPESQCAKNQRNGPCGGTHDGACEVGEKPCIWSQAYERLKSYGEEEQMLTGPVVIRDGSLRGSSAWANAFLGRDHRGKKAEKS
ncbi:MAG TPA: methylenetetrahydrofolate reductase C-terminal domain-containing protein [Bryobacteraceae bacterium]|nr:methylenetetrahydrofolate reductase C-terminal domain-containing protein [Bryobacteraceae bacterium]